MNDTASGTYTPPQELVEAVNGEHNSEYYLLPEGRCHKLLSLGRSGKRDYTWGFRIYRTTYNTPESDSEFARAIEILNAHMRVECFSYCDGDSDLQYVDGKANRLLWQRMKHDIIQDSALLEGVSEFPVELLKMHQD
jgi:hypothetical protein